ncbi:MAG: polysaccharide deacetylase family protein, partial [Candidatus Sumerlaeota bacterium]|nr:polysaccharide deacetylase family protein [Candidatus Sumerlaeota bacterium]
MPKPTASLSLDLDNLWCYLKVHGDAQWRDYPTYLPQAAPVILDFLRRHGQTVTVFVVGQDAAREVNREALRRFAEAGHEIGNHSMNHEPWMQTAAEEAVAAELAEAEGAIQQAAGQKPVGFRGPGYCRSAAILTTLKRMNYEYDASTLPTILGPLARLYYFATSRMNSKEREERKELFGRWRDGFMPIRPYEWATPAGGLLEIPVSVMPLLRTPFHLSYIVWLSRFSPALALAYLRTAFALCRLAGVGPSFLIHPLDFLGREDVKGLEFFPGMDLPRARKMELAERFLGLFRARFDVVPLAEHARR